MKKSRIICCECWYANRIILCYGRGCYRCSSHSLCDLEGEEVLIFFYTGREKRFSEYWTGRNEIMVDQTDIPWSSNNKQPPSNQNLIYTPPEHFMRTFFFIFRDLMIPTCTTWTLSLPYFLRSSYHRAAISAPPLSHASSSVNLTLNRSVLGNAHTAERWNNCEQDAATFLGSFFSLEKPVHSGYREMNVICSLVVKFHTNCLISLIFKVASPPQQNKEAHIVASKWPNNWFHV